MNLKKLVLLPISLVFSAAGCAGIGPNATYNMGTVSFNYNPTYASYMVKLNGTEIGGGYGRSMNTSPVKVGTQIVTWRDAKTGQVHNAKNEVSLTKEDLKGMKYLAVHLYPDDSIEITTSNNWPNPTTKGDAWYDRLNKNK
ncbi:hypothetical protein F909_03717 [Acinetobacter sp. ANC 3929]|uniref:hypothetical protein n=1 Tax=unclassified Acinetobacter TaxID=196816 RepID=UPI0002D010DE|nr:MULTISPECIES: hypothetical protein [unclassified Acinetobacter]ENW78755.1 hypothetical protein F909_03717 [Acinetobacter sp. ANC 3929]MCH7351493.1 hypothetical protein [Acinetobacter sp. NIPH 2023]MCH7355805.1 hypothetical protein [Acinetobacter sp. NIPH 1958]MCH7359170.1 hypothetical protein [Acinetobacter sp. NIPH 2024]